MWRHHFLAEIGSVTAQIITFRQQMVEKWLTPRWKGIRQGNSENNVLAPIYWEFCLDQHFFQHFRHFFVKISKFDVTWRHHVGFSPNFQKMFNLWISNVCEKIRSFWPFLAKLWHFLCFFYNMEIYRKKVEKSEGWLWPHPKNWTTRPGVKKFGQKVSFIT